MNELNFRDISSADIGNLGGQYDWIDACLDRDYDRRMKGFNNKDVLMEVVYDKGYYIITLVSDKPFNTIVRNNRYSSREGPWVRLPYKRQSKGSSRAVSMTESVKIRLEKYIMTTKNLKYGWVEI